MVPRTRLAGAASATVGPPLSTMRAVTVAELRSLPAPSIATERRS
jgi:hypothetical protein